MVKQLHPCATALARKFSLSALAILFLFINLKTYGQCGISVETNPNPINPTGCSNGSLSLGSGAYFNISVNPNTYYNFSWANTSACINGFCATPQNGGATSFTSNQTGWFSGSTTTLQISSNRNGCWNSTSGVMTYRYSQPTISSATATPNPICQGSNLNLASASTLVHTSGMTWTGPNSYNVSGANNQTINNVQSVNAGTYTFTADNSGCTASLNTSAVVVNNAASVAAGGPNTVCQSATPSAITLSGASVGGGASTGAWSIISGGGSLSSVAQTASPGSVTYTPAANFSGSVTLRLTTNNPGAPCVAVSADRTITVNPAAVVVAGGPDVLCQSATPSALTLSGANVSGGTSFGAWSIVSGGGTLSSIAATNSPATVTYTPAANYSGSVTLQLTSNDPDGAGPCVAVSASRTITINALATANAAGPDVVCQSSSPTAFALSGATIGGGASTGAWSIVSGGGTLSSLAQTASPASVTYTPAANYSGPVTLRLTTNDPAGPCGVTTSDRTITVEPQAIATPGGPDVACQSSAPSAITLSGASVGGSASTGAWSVLSGSGSLSSVSQTASPQNVTFTPAPNFSGVVVLQLLTNDPVGACNAVSGNRTITVNSGATANAGGPDAVCQSSSPTAITLTGSSIGGTATTAQWSIISGGGTLSNVGFTSSPATVTYTPAANYNGAVTLLLTTNDPDGAGPCGPATSTRSITVRPLPIVSPNSNSPVCTGAQINLSANPSGGTSPYTFSWSGPSFSNSTATPSISNATVGNSGAYSVTVTDNFSCSSSSSTSVVVNPLPNGSILGSTSICFNTSTTLTFNFNSGTGPFDVIYSDGTNSFPLNGINSGHTVSVSPSTTTTYTFTSIIDGNTCSRNAGFTAGAVVTVTPLPVINSVTKTDVLCFGDSTGTITVNASSGTAPLSYSKNGGASYQPSNVFTGLPIGTYTIAVRDAQGCDAVSNPSLVINQPTDITHSAVTVDASCQNVFDGRITITAAGGVPPYRYSINGGPTQLGNQFTGLAAGNYSISVFDFNNCVDTSSVIINNSYSVTGSLTAQTNVSCFGGTNGAISVQLTGGTPAYLYSLNGGVFGPTSTFTGLSAATYVVTLRDSKGCTDFVTTTVTQPNQLAVVIDVVNGATCNGANDGEIFITVNGGTAPYTYNWSNGASTEDVTGLAAGTWTVTITDNKGCTTTTGASVTQPLSLVVSLASSQNLKCFNDSSGVIDISVSGGIPPYQYVWSNGETTEDIYGLHAGTYTVTVLDANLCQKTLTKTITEPALLTATITGVNAGCNGATGSVNLTPSGGTMPYTFLWSNGATTEDLSNVVSGTYTVIITDAKGCSISRSINITQPSALGLSISTTNISCNGGIGGIDLTVVGGTPAYTYVWSNGDATEDPTTNIVAGTYFVTVTDNNGCSASASATVGQPSQPVSSTISSVNITCNGAGNGSINLTVNGGTQPYNYIWSNGATTEDLNGLNSGLFVVTVTDGNGCTTNNSATISEPSALTASIAGTNILCFGGNNGAADLSVSGGNAGYTYLWSNFANTEDLSSLSAGNYSVIVTDTKGCQATASIVISQPSPITLSNSVTNVLCNGGSGAINLTVTGGTPAYAYLWSNGDVTEDPTTNISAGTYTVTVTDNNSCSASASTTVSQPTALALTATQNNVSCNAGNNGSINITVGGGTTPYSFAWSSGATTEDISGLSANTYSVTVTDANGCVISNSYTITQPSALTSSITGTNVTCSGSANGAANLTVTGGSTPYTYLWSNFVNTEDLSGISGGLYYVIITDANGCTKRDSIVITQPAAINISALVSGNLCNGNANGNIDLTITGGTSPFSFVWSNGAVTEDISGLASGIYTVTVTDANNCFQTGSYIITQPAQAISLTLTATDATCNGSANGSIISNFNGGTSPYSFLWSNGATTSSISGLSAGSYYVTITDFNGCTKNDSAVIAQPAALSASIVGSNVSCFGGNDGSADLSVIGGNAPYNYFWSTFEFTEDISNLVAGNYVVIVTDAKSCQTFTSVTITQPAKLNIVGITTNVSCNGANDGFIDITTTGGTGPYAYLWNDFNSSEDRTGLAGGNYTVTVFDNNSCTATASFTIINPAPIVISSSVTNVNCNGNGNGAIDITVSGGTGIYSYAWSNTATSQDISGLNGGNYSVVVRDVNFCSATATFVISEPAAIVSSISGTNISCSGASNGATTLTVSGGTMPYTYLWSTFQTTQNLSGLSAGQYFVSITDANGCTKRDSIVITSPTALQLSVVSTSISCNGGTSNIDLTVSGGTTAYSYVWSNGATTQDLSSVAAGVYSVTVTDANSCSGSISTTVSQPSAMVLNATTTNVGCNGGANGSVDITVQGGVFPYSFAWSNSANTEDINGLSGGTYSVTITDANSCTISASYAISEPSAITSSIVGTNVTCFGAANGAADLSVSGGTSPYSYLWNTFQASQDLSNIGGGTFYVIITDANGCTKRDSIVITEPAALALSASSVNVSCNGGATGSVTLSVSGGVTAYSYLWSNGATTQSISGLSAGNYSVTVTDANLCTATVTRTITQPAALSLVGSATPVSCNGGSNGTVNITLTGGVLPYVFAWSNGSTNEDLTGLSQGIYSVTATDANACTVTGSFTINEPTAIISNVVATNVNCNGAASGAADLTVSGGTLPYTFSWSNFQVSEDISNLSGGAYFVSIVDANGCVRRDSAIIAEPSALQVSATATQVTCNGNNSGAIDLTVNGGTPAYTYLWSNGATSEDLSNIVAGTYVVTVTDANLCTATFSTIITQPNNLLASGTKNDVLCAGGNTGIVNLNVSGGTAPYSFVWSNGATTEDLTGLTAGTYDVTVTDANICSATASFVIAEPTAIVSSVVGTNVLCQGANNGTADLTVSGGTQPYLFFWSNFQGSEDIANLDGGIYYVIITDANGCTKRDSVIIQEPSPLILSTVNTNITCFNANNGSIDLTVQGGTSNYSYLWSNGATSQDLTNLAGGTYVVTVTDFNGCTAVTSSIIINPSDLTTNFVDKSPLCFSDANGSIDLIPTGGTPSYTFIWSNGATTEDISGLTAGVYVVTMTDSKGCKDTTTITITEPNPLVTSGFITNVSCANSGNGFVDITAYGGTQPYQFLWSPGGQSTEDIGGLPGGNYTVSVTDFNNCSVATLYIVEEPTPLVLNITGTNVSCAGGNNGTIASVVSGGTEPYQYLWDDFTSDSIRTGLAAGYYVLEIIDSNGCVVFDSLAITEPSPLTLAGVTTNILCNGASTGAIDISIAGGVASYTYLWSNGAVTEDLNGITAGTYAVGVTDANGCVETESFTLTQPLPINLQLLTNKPNCSGGNNGSASVIATQGLPPYSYAWNTTPIQNTATAQDLGAGTWVVTVTDASACSVSGTVVLTQPTAITVVANSQAAKCFNTSSGIVTLNVTGGQAPYIYDLNGNTQLTDTFVGLMPGNYVVVVRDVNGCEGTASFNIAQPSQISVDLTASQQVILTGMQTQLVASAISTQPIVNIFWNPDSLMDYSTCGTPQNCNAPYATPSTTTIFTVTVMNSDSCYASDTITIFVDNEASKFIPTAFTPNGDGLNDRFEFDILGADKLDVSIYNRWGERVYYNPSQANGITGANGWDGTKGGVVVPQDTYIYRIAITYFDNTVRSVEGTVTLMK